MRAWRDVLSGVRTLASAAVYATLIATFGFQVARVDGLSTAPTLQDQDRLIVNRLAYQLGDPRRGEIVMLHYPRNPEMLFIKRVMAKEGDIVQSLARVASSSFLNQPVMTKRPIHSET